MIHKPIVQPFNPANDALELESQTLRNTAAAPVFDGTLDRNAIEIPFLKRMNDKGAAACRHDAPLVRDGSKSGNKQSK